LEAVVSEAVKILSQFYKDLAAPSFDPPEVFAGTEPDPDEFNNNFQMVIDDLTVCFKEFENLEGVVLGNFNYMVSRLNRLNRRLKSVSSQLGDFVLFSNLATKDALFFSDSFNSLERVEANSPLLNVDQAEINQAEGIVTLPIDYTAEIPINVTEIPVINSNSNGTVGNNEEADKELHGTIADILDNNADTWFEYERVLVEDDGEALVLDFTINLGTNQVVNFIRINPNNFGTRTQVEILTIETSVDGEEFVNIKDDIPVADFTAEDNDTIFVLAPSTSKFAGQGLYTFTPRKAKYVHLVLRQTTPHLITTSDNIQKFRYAIGVRDVEVRALPYKSEGQIVSTNYSTASDIRKVVLESNQFPSSDIVSKLAAVVHSVSPDNGVSWHQIRPKVSAGVANVAQDIPELLDFNGIGPGSVATSNPVRTLRYRATLGRNTDAFDDSAEELAQVVERTTELHQPPATTPFAITLQNAPLEETLRLIDPAFGSRGNDEVRYNIATGSADKKRVRLPFSPLQKDYGKSGSDGNYQLEEVDPQEIFVDGELWSRDLVASGVDVSGGGDTHYSLDFEEGILETGDGTVGKAPAVGATISMALAEERLFPSRGDLHFATLQYPTSNDKKQVEISVVQPVEKTAIVLKKNAKRHVLLPYMELVPEPVFSDTTNFSTRVPFINGETELTAPGEYSINETHGIVYSFRRSSAASDTTVIFYYTPRKILGESDWDFVEEETSTVSKISISNDVYETFPADAHSVPAGVKYFNLSQLAVVKGTVEFTSVGSGVLDTEVNYVDGRTELLGVIHVAEELEAIDVAGAGVVTIPFKLKITSATDFAVNFSDSSVFATDVSPGTPSSAGEYAIDRSAGTTGQITVYVDDDVSDPGSVDYYYVDPQADLTGRYSINYDLGEVFLHDATSGGSVDFEYTDFRAKYNIARLVSSEDWEYNADKNQIVIKDREILRNKRTPQTLGDDETFSQFYQVVYKYVKQARPDITELEPFYSPVLKDYALKIITKDNLV
jgi:hypothetical protein